MQKNIVIFAAGLAGEQNLVKELQKSANVFRTSDAEHLTAIVSKGHTDIVLFEITTQTVHRIELLNEIKTTQPTIKMLVLNGMDDRDVVSDAIACGVCDVFHQPYRYDLIAERIHNLCV